MNAKAAMAVCNAERQVARELHIFAETRIAEPEQADFFHPCNRDQWVAAFCEWLAAKQAKSAEVRASND